MKKSPVTTWERFLAVAEEPAIDLYHEEEGKGPPLLMVHGFCTHLYTWRHIRKALSKNHKLYMVDLKGFGHSVKATDGNYTVYDQAHALIHFIKKNDLKGLTLVGHSFGGGVSLITALYLLKMMPERIEKLVLIDSVGYPQTLPPFLNLVQLPLVGDMGVNIVSSRMIIKGMFARAYYDQSAVTKADIEAYARPFDEPDSRKALLMASRHMIPGDMDELSMKYNGIDLPTLILWGREDKVVPLKIGKRLHADLKNSRFVVFDECGHVPHEERPEETLEVLMDFLENS